MYTDYFVLYQSANASERVYTKKSISKNVRGILISVTTCISQPIMYTSIENFFQVALYFTVQVIAQLFNENSMACKRF